MKALEIILICISAIIVILLGYNWRTLNTPGKVALSVLLFTALITAINSYKQSRKDAIIERINAKYGDIRNQENAKLPQLALGNDDSSASIEFTGPDAGITSENKYGEAMPMLKLSTKDGTLIINSIIRDLQGQAIAVIEDNTWTVFDDNYEYNDDNERTFELVTKGDRKVYYQIELKKDVAHVSGYVLDDRGFGFIFYNTPSVAKGSYFYRIDRHSDKLHIPPDIDIPRIFKYPREKYYSQRL